MVDTTEERQLREQQLESWGRLLAGLSHELKNHLGIIRESGGLISDMVEIHGKALDPSLADRLLKAAANIEKRVAIAADLLHHLSSFAHRADSPTASVSLGDILREEAAFLQRFAKMKQVELQIETEEDVVLITSPTLLHHLIYRLFLFALEQLPVGETLTIAVKRGEHGGKICFYAGESALDRELPMTEYNSALQAIAGAVSMQHGQIILEFC